MSQSIKAFAKRILPESVFFLYHSVRASWKLGILPELVATRVNAPKKVRLGEEAGWNIPRAILREQSICYCVGCGEDITFDLELIRACACTVFAFDPTPQAITHVNAHAAGVPNYRFSHLAIWDKDDVVKFYASPFGMSHSITNLEETDKYIEVPARRLKQVLETNGHSRIALLKMDIEGAEHTVLRTVVEDNLQIDVICVEFDYLAKPPTPARLGAIRESIKSLLDAGYGYFWIEGSNFTFVRRSLPL